MKRIILSSLYLLTLFCLSKFVFEPTHLYYELWWLDIPMHIMGGFGVALLTGTILLYKRMKVSYLRLFIVYILVAVLWEVYEYTHDLIVMNEWNGLFATIKDLIVGFIGMSIAYLFIKK